MRQDNVEGSGAIPEPSPLPQRTKEAKAAYMRDWARRNPEKVRRINLKKMYGITPEQYDEMMVSQGGVCAICHKTCQTGRRLSVDHNHATGAVRALLCGKCNTAIGMFRDDPTLIGRAQDYLEHHRPAV